MQIIEEQLLSIMTSTKILLNEIKSNTDLNRSKIKDTVNKVPSKKVWVIQNQLQCKSKINIGASHH